MLFHYYILFYYVLYRKKKPQHECNELEERYQIIEW